MARATQSIEWDTLGAPFGNLVLPAAPPVSPLSGQGWWCVIGNLSRCAVEVFGPTGAKWLHPYTVDSFGSNCDPLIYSPPAAGQAGGAPFRFIWVDFAQVGAQHGALTLSWATETDSYQPGNAYPFGA